MGESIGADSRLRNGRIYPRLNRIEDYFCHSRTLRTAAKMKMNEVMLVITILTFFFFYVTGGLAVNRKPNYGGLVSANTMNWRE